VNFLKEYRRYKRLVDRRLAQRVRGKRPESLYGPIRYVLDAGGKRVRPILTLLGCEAVGGTARSALDAAVAIEVLHTFTLVHDDIMDNAPTRRGRDTIHRKWGRNAAILVGDHMVALAYQSLLQSATDRLFELSRAFTQGFHDVCEGQGLDEELEHRSAVSIRNYVQMIDKKTAALIATATVLGGIVGGGSRREVAALRRYGEHLGRAFQIQDDLLDLVADEREFGKSTGGDLKRGKKTYPLLRGMERTRGKDRSVLLRVFRREPISNHDVRLIRSILQRAGVLADARVMVKKSTRRAQQALRGLPPGTATAMLGSLADELLQRTS